MEPKAYKASGFFRRHYSGRKGGLSMGWNSTQGSDVDELIFAGDEQVMVSER